MNPKRQKELYILLEERGFPVGMIVGWRASGHHHIAFSYDDGAGVAFMVGGAACTPGEVHGDDNFVSKAKRYLEAREALRKEGGARPAPLLAKGPKSHPEGLGGKAPKSGAEAPRCKVLRR